MARSVTSDGEEDDDLEDIAHDMNDDDQSPRDSRNGRESLESNSEQSVTSPAGFGSLPSIGSPASVASPSDSSNYETSLGLVPSSSSNWFSPPQQGSTSSTGAFKPPVPTSSASAPIPAGNFNSRRKIAEQAGWGFLHTRGLSRFGGFQFSKEICFSMKGFLVPFPRCFFFSSVIKIASFFFIPKLCSSPAVVEAASSAMACISRSYCIMESGVRAEVLECILLHR